MEELKLQGKEYNKDDETYCKAYYEQQGGTARGGGEKENLVNLEETRPGYVASTLKAADQMAGQTFNDVGRIDDECTFVIEGGEGAIVIERERKNRHGKM
ncbi:hypothetical protein FNV43_RR15664 [Rhamnella rubrinervis]|uniref:Uncharacterized protein n=1 Tax=Rhamnella rubrinervis TaxID=2594499 RepID=A0A8K0E9B2_9ROSA|nr:hypothetical protein FNV43_RR15664 [Rhamnella rubrinervis]